MYVLHAIVVSTLLGAARLGEIEIGNYSVAVTLLGLQLVLDTRILLAFVVLCHIVLLAGCFDCHFLFAAIVHLHLFIAVHHIAPCPLAATGTRTMYEYVTRVSIFWVDSGPENSSVRAPMYTQTHLTSPASSAALACSSLLFNSASNWANTTCHCGISAIAASMFTSMFSSMWSNYEIMAVRARTMSWSRGLLIF